MDFDKESGNNTRRNRKQKLSFTGRGHLEGGTYDEPVKVSGALTIASDLKALALKVSGKVSADGNVTLDEQLSCSGRVAIAGALIAKTIGVSGKLAASTGIEAKESMKISGTIDVEKGGLKAGLDAKVSGKAFVGHGDMSTERGDIIISGKINLGEGNVDAGQDLRISGKFDINGNVVAKRGIVIRRRSSGIVHGDVTADAVGIGIGDGRGSNVSRMPGIRALKKLTDVMSQSSGLVEITGSVRGDEIFLQDAHVRGDVDGNMVVLGENVTVDGQIRYRTSIVADEENLVSEPFKTDEPLALDSGDNGPAK